MFLPYTAGYYPYPYGTFGLGYFYFDPLWWGYPSYGYGPGWYGYGTGWSGAGAGYSSYGFRDVGGLRLKVKPRLAQVFVDGYYVGLVNDFDGVFQRLTIDAGPHRIEIRAEGFEPLAFEVLILEGETISYRGELRRR
ncbi:MAG: PEGA domain-containing protein [Acidobacteria bacterium]|nr:PEGA domain-containing protein [Acidobacteriota bacterium]